MDTGTVYKIRDLFDISQNIHKNGQNKTNKISSLFFKNICLVNYNFQC